MAQQRTSDGNGQQEGRSSARAEQIGIAIVEHQGHLLVGLRGANQVLAGFSEFPGGKRHCDESDRDCVIRECLEETGLKIEPFEQLDRIEHSYSHGSVSLSFWLCRPVAGDLTQKSGLPVLHGGFYWQPVTELARLRFPDANAPVLEKLAARYATESDSSQ